MSEVAALNGITEGQVHTVMAALDSLDLTEGQRVILLAMCLHCCGYHFARE